MVGIDNSVSRDSMHVLFVDQLRHFVKAACETV